MKKQRVVYINKPGEIEINEREIPVLERGDALLKIKYCGICGSDLACYTGNQPFATYPRIPGHEFSAELVDVALDDFPIKPGTLVTANPYFNCGHCYPCKNGKINCCEDNQTMGVQRDGSFAEYVKVPAQRVIDGKNLTPELLALVEPFSIGYHAINRGDIGIGDRVLVVGAGPIGIFAAISAKIHGAAVYITDILDLRLKMAKSIGADITINSKEEDLCKRVLQLTDGNGMDICVEAAGLPDTFLSCIENTCFGGKVILIGNGKREVTFNHSVLLKKELNVYGSRNSLHDFEPIIDMLSKGEVKIDDIVTDVYDVEDVKEAFEALKHNDGSMAKVLIKLS